MEQHNTLWFLLLCCLLPALGVSCEELTPEQATKINEALRDSLTSTTESWNIDMEMMEEGHKKMHLTGSYAATYTTQDSNATRIKGPVHIQIFDTTGAVTTRARSNRAVYDVEDAVFKLYGNVKVNTASDRHLESEYLKWRQNDNKISTPKFVIITTPTDSIAGTGFEGTTDLSSYTIKEPKGEVYVD